MTLWDVATGKPRWTRQRPESGYRAAAMAYSPAGDYLAVLSESGLHLTDVETGTEWRPVGKMTGGERDRFCFSPDGRTLAVYQTEPYEAFAETVTLWETATGKKRGAIAGCRGGVYRLAFSPDGRVLATANGDTSVLLWDLTGKLNPAVRARGKPKAAEFDALWAELAAEDAEKAYRVIQHLAAHPAAAAALVKAKLPPVKESPASAAEIEKLIAALDHDDFARRQQASQALAGLGKLARPALTKALQTQPTPETKRRLTELLDALKTQGPRPETVRPTRALELLERVATPEAKQVLEELARGHPDAPLTQDAKASLKRLAVRAGAQGN